MRKAMMKTITSLVLVIAMAVGMTASFTRKADAAAGVYYIYFSSNGMSGVSNLPKTVPVAAGQLCSIPSQKPTRFGYIFEGYDTSSSAKKVQYKAGQGNVRLSKSITLYPVWSGGPSTFSIIFSSNGISGVSNLPKTITTDPRYTVTIPSQKPTRSGYDFQGYDTSSSAKSIVYKAGQGNIKLTKNITLYPVWACNHSGYSQTTKKSATCTEKGSILCKCKRCGKEWTTTTNALGHNFVNTTSPYAPASPYKECSRCHISQNEAASDGHIHEGPVQRWESQSSHVIKCNKCGQYVSVPHDWATVGYKGSHYPGCKDEKCMSNIVSTLQTDNICRNHVTNWEYYVDTVSFSQNLYLRQGTCPICNSVIIEFGHTTWSDTATKEKAFEKALNTIISAGKFALTFTGKDPSTIIKILKVLSKIHSGYSLAKGIVDTTKTIATCSDNSLNSQLKNCDLSSLENLIPIPKSETVHMAAAQKYYNTTKNMKTIYIPSHSN